MVKVKFYTKEGCWLCDAAQELLNGVTQRHGLVIDHISIDSDEELYELYRFDVPVLEFPDGTTLHGRIRKKDLMGAIDANKE